jgi:zinc transporter ZupT
VALVLFDLFPEILTLAPKIQISLEMPFFTIIIGFLFLYSLDRGLFQTLKKSEKNDKLNYKTRFGTLAALEFSAHGFIEGLAIGISFQFGWSLGLVVAFAVISHDFCDGLSTLTLMLNSGNTMRSSMKMLFLDAIAPIIGAVTTLFFYLPNYYIVFAISFLAGSFVYMGAGSLLPEAHRKNRPKVTLIFFVTGFISIFLLSRIFNA